MKNALFAGALLAAATPAALAQTLPVEKYPFVSGPVTITSCSVNENTSNSTVSPNSLRINYYGNQANRRLTSITFRVRYAQTPVTVTDTGAFDYKQSVTHQFNLLGGLPWTGPMPTECRVVTATFDDGKIVTPEAPDAMPSDAASAAPPDTSASTAPAPSSSAPVPAPSS